MSSASDEDGAARARALARPRLRAVEIIRVPEKRGGGLVTLLRDSEKVAPHNLEVPAPLDLALAFMDGRHDCPEIARLVRASAASQGGAGAAAIDTATVQRLARDLERAAMLEGPTAMSRRRTLVAAFKAAKVRPASFAGGAYHDDPGALGSFIDDAFERVARRPLRGAVRGLVSPHMDFWRAADGYAAAYAPLRDHFPTDVETIVVLGTCHAGMHSAFAFTKKGFRTPFGVARTDEDFVEGVAVASGVDVFADEYKHQGEHSIEFQVVHLQHVLGKRRKDVRIVPILCGLGRAQARRSDPRDDAEVERVLDAMVNRLARTKALVVAGADLAHVGPRFGDGAALDREERAELAERDGESIRRLMSRDAAGFFDHVTEDLDERRVCGTGPLYTLLRALEAAGATEGELFGYTQNIDPDEGSIVSHASLAFVEG
ncbi:MAG: AmmeMemoRadiSam system protein B [Polyangiaceae bacterium]|nr:AmmeMemoRadiSam system protein B [Polyangiaceae bacterium]